MQVALSGEEYVYEELYLNVMLALQTSVVIELKNESRSKNEI